MFVSMKKIIAFRLQSCITRGKVPDWMTTDRTILLLKDKSKGNEVKNYRPITCSPLMWKLLTGIVADDIYNHLEENGLLPEEQKGYRRNNTGTKDWLLFDKAVVKNCNRRKAGLSMDWIDYLSGVADNINLIFCPRVWKAGKRSSCRRIKSLLE